MATPPDPAVDRDPYYDDPVVTQRNLWQASPALARLAVNAWVRTAQWTLATSARATGRVLRAATTGESPADLVADARAYVRDALGVAAPDGAGAPDPMDEEAYRTPTDSLRERGAELLRRSTDVHVEEDAHPAYDRILEELAPDEARVLRLLALEGPQPSVDVRGAKGIPVTTQLVAPGLSMIGAQAGTRHLDRVPAYLNNLYRLGLIWFSREPLEDPLRYQVLEAQPDVIEALRHAGRGRKTVRRSVHLTPFGDDFCRVCLPLDTAEIDALGRSAGGITAEPDREA